MEADRSLVEARVRMLSLPKPFKDATSELDYLYEQRPVQQTPSADEADLDLFAAVTEMKTAAGAEHATRQYTETNKALNRMRHVHGRKEVATRGRRRSVRTP